MAVAQLWLIMFDPDVGVVNTLLGLLHVGPVPWLTNGGWVRPTLAALVLWKNSGFAIVVMLAALQSIPQDVYEASAVDGATPVTQFFRITLPLLRPTIAFFVVISTIGVIQMFAEPYVLFNHAGGPGNAGVTAGYNLFFFINNQDLGTGAANSFLLLVILAVVALVMVRVLRAGEET